VDYTRANFGVDSSGHFHFIVRTHRHTRTQSTTRLITLPTLRLSQARNNEKKRIAAVFAGKRASCYIKNIKKYPVPYSSTKRYQSSLNYKYLQIIKIAQNNVFYLARSANLPEGLYILYFVCISYCITDFM